MLQKSHQVSSLSSPLAFNCFLILPSLISATIPFFFNILFYHFRIYSICLHDFYSCIFSHLSAVHVVSILLFYPGDPLSRFQYLLDHLFHICAYQCSMFPVHHLFLFHLISFVSYSFNSFYLPAS